MNLDATKLKMPPPQIWIVVFFCDQPFRVACHVETSAPNDSKLTFSTTRPRYLMHIVLVPPPPLPSPKSQPISSSHFRVRDKNWDKCTGWSYNGFNASSHEPQSLSMTPHLAISHIKYINAFFFHFPITHVGTNNKFQYFFIIFKYEIK